MKIIYSLILCLLFPALAQAQDHPKLKFIFDTRAQFIMDENRDLDTPGKGSGHAATLDARFKLDYKPSATLRGFLDVSAVTSANSNTKSEDITGVERPSADYLQLRQAWINIKPLDKNPFSLQLGRQRIRDDYALWWNSDLDAVRALYKTETFKGFIGVAENFGSYRSSHSLEKNSRDILHVMGEISAAYSPDDKIELRALYEDDHSGLEKTGQVINYADYDREDGQLTWAGLRLAGKKPQFNGLKYRLDTLLASGSVETIKTAGKLVTGSQKENILGWAVDGGVEIPLAPSASLLLGYAQASKEFRQSEIYGNSSPLGLSTSSIHHYGEVLRPELGNIHVLTTGLSFPVLSQSNLTLLYHYSQLNDAETGLQKTRINAVTNGEDSVLGHEIDAVMNIDIDQEISLSNQLSGRKNIRLSAGAFRAGDAFGAAEGEMSYRMLAEFRLRY